MDELFEQMVEQIERCLTSPQSVQEENVLDNSIGQGNILNLSMTLHLSFLTFTNESWSQSWLVLMRLAFRPPTSRTSSSLCILGTSAKPHPSTTQYHTVVASEVSCFSCMPLALYLWNADASFWICYLKFCC